MAAGSSRRMGRPKPILDFDGRTCLDLVLEACLGSGSGEVLLVLGAGADRIRSACRLPAEVVQVFNADHQRGQTSSVKAGLRALEELGGDADGFFILPVDLPLVAPADLVRVREVFEDREDGKTIVIPTHEGRRGHPVLLEAAHRQGILELDDVAPLHDYIRARAGEVALVPLENEGIVARMNTEEEYGRVLALFRRRQAKRS